MSGDKSEIDAQNYISTKKAADELDYTIQHIRLLIRQGKIDAVKFGRDWMVVHDSVTEYKTKRKNEE